MNLKFWLRPLILISLALLPLRAQTARAQVTATYYVATTGSDSNPGTLAQPWATMQHAGETAAPGDTVLVRGGTYMEGEIWLRADYGHCGTAAGGLVTIRAYPGETPLFTNAARSLYLSCDYIRIEGLHFTNGKSIAIWGLDRTTVQLVNNSFTGTGYAYDAISSEGNHILLEGNVCDIQGNSMGTQGHCYYIHHGSNITLRNNVARGMTGYGIHLFDQRRSEDPTNFTRLIKDVLIEGNVSYESKERSGLILAASDGARVENVIIRNNIFFSNPVAGIDVASDSRNVSIYNNTLYNNGLAGVLVYGTETLQNIALKNNLIDLGIQTGAKHIQNDRANVALTLDHNLYWPGPPKLTNVNDSAPVVGNPQFVNAASRDFHLPSHSAAVEAGATLVQVAVDKDGVTRPQGAAYDLGAYEFKPALTFTALPGNHQLKLNWSVNVTLPVTSTWQLAYSGPTGELPSPIIDIPNAARTYTLTGLTNYALYTLTLSAPTAGAVISHTVTARPTDRFVFLPHIRR